MRSERHGAGDVVDATCHFLRACSLLQPPHALDPRDLAWAQRRLSVLASLANVPLGSPGDSGDGEGGDGEGEGGGGGGEGDGIAQRVGWWERLPVAS
ncbi:unnamed protein product, partial [Closterium sp. NIES-53]